MDCRGWGSSGWKLLHTLALLYDESFKDNLNNDDEKEYQTVIKHFLTSIQYVLPCIYCRRSYRKYINELPVQPFLTSHNLFEWIYHIHNKVNDKLRGQGYKIEDNPSLSSVRNEWYKKDIKKLCRSFPHHFAGGWDFLYCIVLNFPFYGSDLSERRYQGHLTFFHSLGKLIDGNDKMFSIKKLESVMKNRNSFSKWLYNIECKGRKSKSHTTYQKRCERFERHRVEKCTGETCRNK